jgi:hypothetical protein
MSFLQQTNAAPRESLRSRFRRFSFRSLSSDPMLATTEIELPFAAYQQRQWHEVSPEGLRARAERLTPGQKFAFQAGSWVPVPYVGHAIVAMAGNRVENEPLMTQLASIQNELSYNFADTRSLYLLPEASLHQTIANTLSAERHQQMVVDRGLSSDYPRLVTNIFDDLPTSTMSDRLSMRMIGLSIFSNAVGLLGVFDQEEDFQRIIRFRNHFYGHEQIGNLGIRRTRPFIGHITVAYIESPLDSAGRHRLVDAAQAINQLLSSRDVRFYLPVAELRAYEHLAEFKALPGLPVYRL